MKYTAILCAVLMAASVGAQTFTDVDSPQYHGFQELNEAIDANYALLESGGTIDGSFDNLSVDNGLSVQGEVSCVSTSGATTNVIVDVNAEIDGEYIKDDTIDDDSIDFGDVTGADLTLTDCGAVSGSTLTSATTLTLTDLPAADGAALVVDADASGASTNFFLELGASITVTDDGGGGLIETNTAAAAEYGLRCKINGATYFILLEKE